LKGNANAALWHIGLRVLPLLYLSATARNASVNQVQLLSIKPGTLHDTTGLQPVGHIWVDSKQPWVEIGHDTLQYGGNPESFDALLDAWVAIGGVRSFLRMALTSALSI
jgi:hypothetical protein